MFAINNVQTAPKRLALTAGLVISAALFLLSPDAPEPGDMLEFGDRRPVSEMRSLGGIAIPQPVPPSMQEGVFR